MQRSGAARSWTATPSATVAVAIFSADPMLRRDLERRSRADPTIILVDAVDRPPALLQAITRTRVDAVLADTPSREQLADWRPRQERTAFVILLDGADREEILDALNFGAAAILPRSASWTDISTAIRVAANGFIVLQRELLGTLLGESAPHDGSLGADAARRARLTPRELEVLVAMADGASNKAIARRLDISFHTAKFHVAAILEKLDADSRTEAVTRAAQLGLVML
jgi:DNA-binding NarL/FixJ family response regulator